MIRILGLRLKKKKKKKKKEKKKKIWEEGRLRSRGLRMQIADKSHSQRDVLVCSKKLRSLLFFVMPRLLLLSSPILASCLSFLVLGMCCILMFACVCLVMSVCGVLCFIKKVFVCVWMVFSTAENSYVGLCYCSKEFILTLLHVLFLFFEKFWTKIFFFFGSMVFLTFVSFFRSFEFDPHIVEFLFCLTLMWISQ